MACGSPNWIPGGSVELRNCTIAKEDKQRYFAR
jgi:hypothetical protein